MIRPSVPQRSVSMSNKAPNLVDWFNARAAQPSKASKNADRKQQTTLKIGQVGIVQNDTNAKIILAYPIKFGTKRKIFSSSEDKIESIMTKMIFEKTELKEQKF